MIAMCKQRYINGESLTCPQLFSFQWQGEIKYFARVFCFMNRSGKHVHFTLRTGTEGRFYPFEDGNQKEAD